MIGEKGYEREESLSEGRKAMGERRKSMRERGKAMTEEKGYERGERL